MEVSVFLFVGMGVFRVVPSHLLVVGGFGFLVWAVFLFALGWGSGLFSHRLCWMGGMRMGRLVFSGFIVRDLSAS